MSKISRLILIINLTVITCKISLAANQIFTSGWRYQNNRFWIGPEYWANRIQDWKINNGRLECVEGKLALRTVHLLTRVLSARQGTVEMSVETGRISKLASSGDAGLTGFLIGAGDLDLDYRARSQIHFAFGNNGGLIAALSDSNRLLFLDNEHRMKNIPAEQEIYRKVNLSNRGTVILNLVMVPEETGYEISLSALDENGFILAKSVLTGVAEERLTGNIALIAHKGPDENNRSYWFKNWKVNGTKLKVYEYQAYGPVLGAMYTLSRNVLKMTAQMPPFGDEDNQIGYLEIRLKETDKWRRIAESKLIVPGWTLPFRVNDWDETNDYEYRIAFDIINSNGEPETVYYAGEIKKEPVKDELVVAAFTGNYNGKSIQSWKPQPEYYDFSNQQMWFPHADLDAQVTKHHPDLLVYTGDQIYEGSFVHPDKSNKFSSYLDYLNKWLLFCWAHSDLTRNIPTVCITDDHDVYQINYWGEGGKKARNFPKADSWEGMIAQLPKVYKKHHQHYRHDGGGYEMAADWVNMVQRTQCSHLPDPYNPTLVKQGIEVYYTDMVYGGISFAILEDRKFKSAPRPLLPGANIRNGFPLNLDYDVKNADHPDAILLGERQLNFLENWAQDWKGVWMKAVLSATIFACVNSEPQHTSGVRLGTLPILPKGVVPGKYVPARDLDTNGWPQSGRNKALAKIRKAFGFMIAGDQHLGSVVHHGIDEWNDAGFSFCVPAIGNIAPRRWFTQKPGLNREKGMPPYTGNHIDAFGNKMYVWAVANPYITGKQPAELYDRATGYGIIRFNKKTQTIIVECWSRYANPDDPQAEQYEGWSKTIDMADNYARNAVAYLPQIITKGLQYPPVIQVIDETNHEIVYTVRSKSTQFKPKVFKQGMYTIKVGEPGTQKLKTLTGIKSSIDGDERIMVKFQ